MQNTLDLQQIKLNSFNKATWHYKIKMPVNNPPPQKKKKKGLRALIYFNYQNCLSALKETGVTQ